VKIGLTIDLKKPVPQIATTIDRITQGTHDQTISSREAAAFAGAGGGMVPADVFDAAVRERDTFRKTQK
jgi:hypothetical protein